MFIALENPSPNAANILSQVPVWFEEWEQVLSRFRYDSELTRLNQKSGTPTRVSETLAAVFESALEMERYSAGLVTPVTLNALAHAGYDRSFELFDGQTLFPPPVTPWLAVPGLEDVKWNESTREICLPEGLQLDFGGIAKGWAADQAVERLSAHGPALVNAGGDISISAPLHDGRFWDIGIANPVEPEDSVGVIQLLKGGIATSGKDYRRWQQGNVWKHHIIDPLISDSAETDVLTATVIAPSALEAEAAAKIVLISGSQAGLEWLELQEQLAGMVILESGHCVVSRRMENYLWR